MLLKIAKSNQPIIVGLIPLISLIIWYNPFTNSQNIPDSSLTGMPLQILLMNYLKSHVIISKFLGLVFFISISFYLSHLNTKYIFIEERTYLPSIIYISIVCMVISNKNFFPVLLAAIFLLFAIERLLDSYKEENLTYNVFDSGLLIGIGSMFYFSLVFYIVFFWISLLIIRKFYWREWIFILMGAMIPYLLLFSYYYLDNKSFDDIFLAIKNNFMVHNKIELNKIQNIAGGYIILLILLASEYIIRISPNKKIFARKSFNLFLVLFLVPLAIYLLVPSISIEIVFLINLPLAFLISNYYVRPRISRWLEIIFDLLIITLILSQILVW